MRLLHHLMRWNSLWNRGRGEVGRGEEGEKGREGEGTGDAWLPTAWRLQGLCTESLSPVQSNQSEGSAAQLWKSPGP